MVFPMRNPCKALLFCVFAVSLVSPGQTRREDEPLCGENRSPRVEIAYSDATILGITIGKSTLKDVEAKLGSADVARASSEEESDEFICYVSPLDGTSLFFCTGVMGGGVDVTRFALRARQGVPPRCTPSRAVSQQLATQSGLRLGLTESEIQKIVGKPSRLGRTSIKYDYLCRTKMTEDEIDGFKKANNWDVRSDPYFDRMSWIEIHFAELKSSRLEIGRIESY